MTIAIVDDIKEERVLLRTRLEKIFHQKDMGFHCCEYENGEAFLEASKYQKIQAVLWGGAIVLSGKEFACFFYTYLKMLFPQRRLQWLRIR